MTLNFIEPPLLLLLAIILLQIVVAIYRKEERSRWYFWLRALAITAIIAFHVRYITVPPGHIASLAVIICSSVVGAGYIIAFLPKLDWAASANQRPVIQKQFFTIDLVAATLLAGLTMLLLRPAMDLFQEVQLLSPNNTWGILIAGVIACSLILVIAFMLLRSAIKILNRVGITDPWKRLMFTGICTPLTLAASMFAFLAALYAFSYLIGDPVEDFGYGYLFWPLAIGLIVLNPLLRFTLGWALALSPEERKVFRATES